MYSPEEQQFMEMASKFRDELAHLDKIMDEARVRRSELLTLLYGEGETPEAPVLEAAAPVLEKPKPKRTKKPTPRKMTSREQMAANVDRLVSFIRQNPGVGRKEINALFESDNLSLDQLRRIVESAKKRGLIASEGKSRSAKWYAVDGS